MVQNRRQLQALVKKVTSTVVHTGCSFLDGLSNCQRTSAVLLSRSIFNVLERASIVSVCRNGCQPSRRVSLSFDVTKCCTNSFH